jgi:hypothetical protein
MAAELYYEVTALRLPAAVAVEVSQDMYAIAHVQ